MSKTNIYEVDTLKAVTGQATTILTTTPITPYVALYTVLPTDTTAGTEVTGGAYAPVDSGGDWAAPSAGSPSSVANSAAITFPTATADWGTIVGFGIKDAPSGNLLHYGALTQNKTVSNGDTPSFGIGTLTLTED